MLQFRDSIQAAASALKAGYSVENAIREAGRDIAPMYGEDTRIRIEYARMTHQLDMNMTAEDVLSGFAERTGQEDVENFVNVFSAAKKSGGDSISVIRNAVKIISEKIDTEKEIQTMLASKKLEFDIMCAVPFVIILYMKLTFGDFWKGYKKEIQRKFCLHESRNCSGSRGHSYGLPLHIGQCRQCHDK